MVLETGLQPLPTLRVWVCRCLDNSPAPPPGLRGKELNAVTRQAGSQLMTEADAEKN
jgi:hypothetical protein